jgi:LacI family transcriptional regulator
MSKTDRKKITLKEVAESAGVSISTVSRVLRNQASRFRIKDETVETILNVAKELEYKSDNLKDNYQFQNSYTIGLIVPDISNPFFSTIAQRIERESRKLHYLIVLSDSLRDITLEKESVRLLRYRNVDGFIIAPVGTESTHLNRLVEDGIPVVVIDRYFKDVKCPYVISDNYKGAYEATNYLIEMGHRDIACIQGMPENSVNNDRVNGYIDALESHSIEVNNLFILGDSFTEYNGYVNTKILLNRKNKPTAIFTLNNFISIGAYRAILEEGIVIPDDISFIAFDDYQPYMSILIPPLTAIKQQNEEIGHIAFQLLMNQINPSTKSDTENIVLPTKLIIRKSVKDISNNNL